MSLLDAKVLHWVKGAKLCRGDKLDLLQRSLACMENYTQIDDPVLNSKVRYQLSGEIKQYIEKLEADIEEHGEHAIDEGEAPEQFKFGAEKDAADAEAAEAAAAEEAIAAGAAPPARRDVTINDAEHARTVKARSAATRRKTVSSEVVALEDVDNFTPPEFDKDAEDAAWLTGTLGGYYLFDHLESDELEVLVKALRPVIAAEDETLFEQGDDGDTLYIVQSGEAEMVRDGKSAGRVPSGGFVGEEELMYSAQAQFTLRAAEDIQGWSLERETYRNIVTKASIKKRALYEDFLGKIDFLEAITPHERLQVADALKSTEYKDGEKIISYGEEGTHFHIIVTGDVKVVGREGDKEDGAEVDVCTFTVGDCIGELEFINNHATCADVVAVGPVKTAKMGRRHFEKVMGPVEEFLKDRYKVRQRHIATSLPPLPPLHFTPTSIFTHRTTRSSRTTGARDWTASSRPLSALPFQEKKRNEE